MARIGNDIAMGFYSTPLENVGKKIKSLLEYEIINDEKHFHRFFDPCSGEGDILNLLAEGYSNVKTYGVELDTQRFIKSKEKIETMLHAPYENIVCTNEAFSLIFNNPPYNEKIKTGEGYQDLKAGSNLLEYQFLERSYRHLQDHGVLILVVKVDRLSKDAFKKFLLEKFYDGVVFRFNDDEYSTFNQCVFIGKKKPSNGYHHSPESAQIFHELSKTLFNLGSGGGRLDLKTLDDVFTSKITWKVPTCVKKESITFYSKLDFAEDFKDIGSLSVMSKLATSFKKSEAKLDQSVPENQPKMAVNTGQLGLLLVSGMINGEFGKGRDYHMAQGSEHVFDEVVTEEKDYTTKVVSTTKRRAMFTIATPKGCKRLN